MTSENIVQTLIDCLAPTGERFTASVEIGRPYSLPDGHWACPVKIRGLYDNLSDIRGGDSLQALCLAASLVRLLLGGVIEDGGQLLHPNTNDSYELDAIFGSVGSASNRPHKNLLEHIRQHTFLKAGNSRKSRQAKAKDLRPKPILGV